MLIEVRVPHFEILKLVERRYYSLELVLHLLFHIAASKRRSNENDTFQVLKLFSREEVEDDFPGSDSTHRKSNNKERFLSYRSLSKIFVD
jgi:hypothetical protein